jgi:predicted transglutaminase-like cysteine proteinase
MFRITARLAQVGLITIAAFAFAQPSRGQALASLPQASAPALKVGEARPLAAWTEFCHRLPAECTVDATEPAEVALTAKVWQTITLTNRRVNGAIKPVTDQDHWGVADRWDLAEDGYGDCEDYQLLKRKILVEQYGLPRRALRMTVVVDEQGEGHAVMMVKTDSGDLVLDNKRSAILSWQDTGYVFVKREGQDSRDWVSLGDRSSPATTANR